MIEILPVDAKTLPADLWLAADALISDPPYSAHVHSKAVSQSKGRGVRLRDLGFDYLDRETRSFVASVSASVKRWTVLYSDWEASQVLRVALQARGLEYVRTVPWVRWSMPQLSGDRPVAGSEALIIAHRQGAKAWNGPGSVTHLAHLAMRGETKHRAQKPLDQALDLVAWFSDPSDLVVDPFCGSGTVARACQILGRDCVTAEVDPTWAQRASERIASTLSTEERSRVERFLNGPYEDRQTLTEPAQVRKARRLEDYDRAKRWL